MSKLRFARYRPIRPGVHARGVRRASGLSELPGPHPRRKRRPQKEMTDDEPALEKGDGFGGKYYVECPNCGKQSGPYSPTMTRGGRRCSCGVSFAIDVEAQQAGEIVNAPDEESEA